MWKNGAMWKDRHLLKLSEEEKEKSCVVLLEWGTEKFLILSPHLSQQIVQEATVFPSSPIQALQKAIYAGERRVRWDMLTIKYLNPKAKITKEYDASK